jgi:hypothetical protein
MDSEQSMQKRMTSFFPSKNWAGLMNRLEVGGALQTHRNILQFFVFVFINLIPVVIWRHYQRDSRAVPRRVATRRPGDRVKGFQEVESKSRAVFHLALPI